MGSCFWPLWPSSPKAMLVKRVRQKKIRQIILSTTAAAMADLNPITATEHTDLITASVDSSPTMAESVDSSPIMEVSVDLSLTMADMVDISLTMADMVDINPITEDSEDTNPITAMGDTDPFMVVTEDTDLITVATEDTDTANGMVTGILTELAMEITFLTDTETRMWTKHTKIPNPTKFLNLITPTLTITSTKCTSTQTLRMIIKQTTSTLKSGGICKMANMDTSNRNTESTLKFNPIMVTVVITAQDMEVMPMAVTENLITEEATKKITTEEVMEANINMEVVQDMEDTEVVHTAVTKNFEAAVMDRKTPNTIRMDNSGQKMKIKNEIELPLEVSFNVNNLVSFFFSCDIYFLALHEMDFVKD